tara:strand:- start:1825 stop:2694 length:870 start_codon:yes stop_codon:yes gene_type:complete
MENSSPKIVEESSFSKSFQKFSKNKLALAGAVYIIVLVLISVLAPVVTPYDYDEVDKGHEVEGVTWGHWFGTDQLGRDMFSRNIYAARNAIGIGVGAVIIGLLIGAILGSLSGYYGGVIDMIMMRLVDIMIAFPQILLMVLLVGVMGRGMLTIFVAIGLTTWANYARLIRGQVLQAKNNEYVEAARCLGAKDGYIIRKYIFPNILGPIIVMVSFGIPDAMMAESGMSLLGMGLRPPMPSWGNLIADGTIQILGLPHLVLYPALTFGLTLLAFTFIGDGLREVYAKSDTH